MKPVVHLPGRSVTLWGLVSHPDWAGGSMEVKVDMAA